MSNFSGSRALVEVDWDKEFWGNNPAAIQFLEWTRVLESPKRILEIGCGKGFILQYLVENGHHAVGVDMDSEAISKCDDDLIVYQADAAELPFENNVFDVIVSFDLFEHVPDTNGHLREVRRVLKSSGYYLLGTPNKLTNIPFETLRFFLKYGIRHTFDFLKPPEHCSLHSYWQIRNRFYNHGFSIKFYDIPVLNDFFKQKIKRFTGNFGTMILKIINPDSFPMPLRTNFYIEAKLLNG